MRLELPPYGGIEGVLIRSEGLKLLGTMYLARGAGRKPAALVLHGFPGFEKNYDIARALRELGYNALIFHYRGCWGSEGGYDLTKIPTDVKSAIDTIQARPDVDPDKIIAVGHSMGSYAAVVTAAQDSRIKAVVAISGSGDLRMSPPPERKRTENTLQFLSGITFEDFVAQRRVQAEKLNPFDHVAKISPRPILIIHGTEDAIVKPEQAKILYERAKRPKRLVLIEDADHVYTDQRQQLLNTILRWVRRNCKW
jgi:dipeptidyl aminopeptidase/acylaminoacyl peptidase